MERSSGSLLALLLQPLRISGCLPALLTSALICLFYPTLPRVHPFLSVSSAAHLHFTALFYVTNVTLILFYIRITAVQGLNLHQRSLISESNNKHVPTRKLRYFCKCQILLTPCVQFFENQLINMLFGSFKAHV